MFSGYKSLLSDQVTLILWNGVSTKSRVHDLEIIKELSGGFKIFLQLEEIKRFKCIPRRQWLTSDKSKVDSTTS